jgi:hypothetical protein
VIYSRQSTGSDSSASMANTHFMHPPQRLAGRRPVQCLYAERVLPGGQGPFAAQVALAQPVDVLRFGVVRAVNDR